MKGLGSESHGICGLYDTLTSAICQLNSAPQASIRLASPKLNTNRLQ